MLWMLPQPRMVWVLWLLKAGWSRSGIGNGTHCWEFLSRTCNYR